MIDIVLQISMIALSGIAGYGIRALHKPAPKRGQGGRFIKRK